MEIEDPDKNRGKGKGNRGKGNIEFRKFNIDGKDMPESFKRNYIRDMDYDDGELLDLLKQYHEEYGKIPSQLNFMNNLEYPNFKTYINHFGSWSNALKLVGFDVDSVVKEGKLPSGYHKGRLGELLVFNSFKDKNKAVDLSGTNCNSIFDGLCPKGKSYDVKTASLVFNEKYIDSGGFAFHLRNREIKKIDYFYLVAVDEEYTKVYYIWLIPRKDIENVKDTLYISLSKVHTYDKYLVDFSKCNLDFLNSTDRKEELT